MSPQQPIAIFFEPPASHLDADMQLRILEGIHRQVRAGSTLSLGPHPFASVLNKPDDLRKFAGSGVIGFFNDRVLIDAMAFKKIAVVNLNESLAGNAPVAGVTPDNEQIGRLAAEHFLKRGLRRYAYVGVNRVAFSMQRNEAFNRKILLSGWPAPTAWLLDPGVELTPKWFADRCGNLALPIGIFAMNDNLAVRMMVALQAKNLRLPQDAAVIGVDDHDLVCRSAAVPLSSIAPDYEKIGFEAAGLLERILRKSSAPNTVIRVPIRGISERLSSRALTFFDPIIQTALAYMYANANRNYTVQAVVDHCGEMRVNLEMRFMRRLGRSISDEINRLRMAQAKKLLNETDWALGRVAEECGFGDTRQMAEIFTRVEGAVPAAKSSAGLLPASR